MRLLTFTLLLTASTAFSQNYRFQIGANVGVANYLGDIGGGQEVGRDFIHDVQWSTTTPAYGLYVKYALTHSLNFAFSAQMADLHGADSLAEKSGRYNRNLSFKTRIYDFSPTIEWEFFKQQEIGNSRTSKTDFTSYLMAGVGFFHYTPTTYFKGTTNYNGASRDYDEYIELRPLNTEGVAYSKWAFSTILGWGFNFSFNRHINVGFQLGVRTTNTDYIDDISSVYPKYESFNGKTEEGALAQALYYRTDEMNAETSDQEAARYKGQRGDSSDDDSYFFSTLQIGYTFKGSGARYKPQFHYRYKSKGKYNRRTQRYKF